MVFQTIRFLNLEFDQSCLNEKNVNDLHKFLHIYILCNQVIIV